MPTVALALASNQSAADDGAAAVAQVPDPESPGDQGRGHGPPPWAHAGGTGARGHHADADWKQAWRELTPAQRRQRMQALAKAHTDRMTKWERCVAAAGQDEQQRAECEKPLPPGLAKRRP